MAAEHAIAYVTVPTAEEAKTLAGKLVNAKLAACVNIIPSVQSIYLWEGKVEEGNELLLLVKTRKALTQELTQFVIENHSYSCPEVITTDITGGSPAYIKWLQESTKEPSS